MALGALSTQRGYSASPIMNYNAPDSENRFIVALDLGVLLECAKVMQACTSRISHLHGCTEMVNV
jgi:hypothetical protein